MENKNDILKYLNREISNEELMRLKETEDFKTFEKIAHYSSNINTPKVNVAEAYNQFKIKQKNVVKKGKVISINFKGLYKYAAVIAVLLITSYFLLFNSNTNINTDIAETKTFNLPDDSEVTLNANSTLNFSNKNWENKRELELDGEAFFRVNKGKKFTVNTAVGNVTVLGTQFNVKERANYFEVKTYEGMVSVSYKDTIIKLPKGAIFKVLNGTIDSKNTFDIFENSWLQQESNFKSMPLQFVLKELERQFNYTIITKNVDVNVLYTGGFTHKNINTALQSITIPLQLTYKITNDKITIFPNGK